jgi:hypothetical protein
MHNAVKCLKCKTIVESKHGHDFRYCDCGHVFVDGGPHYKRRGWRGVPMFEEVNEDGSTSPHGIEFPKPRIETSDAEYERLEKSFREEVFKRQNERIIK